jgi:hypothetical protein
LAEHASQRIERIVAPLIGAVVSTFCEIDLDRRQAGAYSRSRCSTIFQ